MNCLSDMRLTEVPVSTSICALMPSTFQVPVLVESCSSLTGYGRHSHTPRRSHILPWRAGLLGVFSAFSVFSGYYSLATRYAPLIWSGMLSLNVPFCCNYDRKCPYVCSCQQGDPEYHIDSKFVYQSCRSPCSPVPLSLLRRSFLCSSRQLLVYSRQSPELASMSASSQ